MSKKKPAVEEAPAVPIFDPTVMVRLVANDGHAIYCDRNAARVSKLFKAALLALPPGQDETALVEGVEVTNSQPVPQITIPFMEGTQLEAGVQFLQYKVKADGDPADHRSAMPMPLQPLELIALGTLLRC